jgi:O-antigen/teichoic acid export membrane protein
LVKHFFSAFDAGMYAALSMMGKVIYFAGSSVGYVLFPAVAEREAHGTRSHSLIYASLAIVATISLGLTAGYFLFPRLALQLLFGSSYLAAASYLGLFGLFITFFSLSNVVTTALLGLGRTKIWGYLILASTAQIVGINFFHSSITQVIQVNLAVCATLFVALLLYYRHERA